MKDLKYIYTLSHKFKTKLTLFKYKYVYAMQLSFFIHSGVLKELQYFISLRYFNDLYILYLLFSYNT